MDEELKIELDNLCKELPADNRHPIEIAIEGPLWKNESGAKKCLELISKVKEYGIFNDHTQYFGNSGSPVTYEQLLDWLIERAKIVGSEKAIAEIDYYVTESEVQVEHIELIVGIHVDCEWEFSNGIKFTSPGNISNGSLGRDLVNETFSKRIPYPNVTAVLIAKFEHPVIHQTESDTSRAFDRIKIPYENLKITRLILSLSRPVDYGVHSIASTTISPDNLPFLTNGQGWGIIPFRHPPLGPPILEIEFRGADDLIRKYDQLAPSFKAKLRIPLEKLNSFGSGESLEDRAVDLRICLESIFLADGNKEQLRYRVSLRAALFLGSNLDARKEIFKTVRDSYDMTSTIIHNGKCGSNFDLNKLRQAAELARKAVIKLIDKGPVNWVDLELEN